MIQLMAFIMLVMNVYAMAQTNPSGSTSPTTNNLDQEDSGLIKEKQKQEEKNIKKIREFKKPGQGQSPSAFPANETIPNNAPALSP